MISGVVTRKRLAVYALVVNAICLAIMIFLTVERGWPIVAFALGGFLLSAAYTAPPLRLKKHGLGEPTVIVVWGPLMVGGVYYAATGSIPGAVLLASLPYAILCTTVLMGKHIDKAPWDGPDGTHTLPVILGDKVARDVTRGMFVAFYLLVGALVIADVLPVFTLLVFASFPMLAKVWNVYGQPKPAESPMPNPVWPLWFAPHVVPAHPPRRRPADPRDDRRRHRRLLGGHHGDHARRAPHGDLPGARSRWPPRRGGRRCSDSSPTSTSRSTWASRSRATSSRCSRTRTRPTARSTYWGVSDVPAAVAAAIAEGATEHTPVAEVGGGIVTATVRTPHGAILGLIFNPHFSPDLRTRRGRSAVPARAACAPRGWR